MDIATSIRGARVSDHAQLQALFEELDRLHRDGAPWLLKKPDRDPRPLEWLHTLLANHNSALFVADVGACVGLATVHLRDAPSFEMFIRQRHAVIDDLIVHPDWRRRGIARRLYQACEEWALERKASWVEVTVYDFNADAYDFYASGSERRCAGCENHSQADRAARAKRNSRRTARSQPYVPGRLVTKYL